MSKQVFCTLFDKNYLPQGLSLYYSLKKFADKNFCLYILCLDQLTHDYLQKLEHKNVELIKLSSVESVYPDLLSSKNNRSLIEYYFTLSPFLPLYILEYFEEPIVASLDADLLFLSSPETLFLELGKKSIYIVPHRFRSNQSHLKKSGIYNVQCQIFKNDSTGLTCLRTWSRQCLDWCFDKYENGKFADQKYLDNWPITYRDQIVVSSNIGVGVAPWNVEGEQISYVKNHFYINSKPIIFYHFHGLKVLNRFLIKLGLRTYGTKPNKDLLKLYKDYINLIFSNGVLKKTKNIRTGGYSKLHLIASTIKNKDFLIKFSNIF